MQCPPKSYKGEGENPTAYGKGSEIDSEFFQLEMTGSTNRALLYLLLDIAPQQLYLGKSQKQDQRCTAKEILKMPVQVSSDVICLYSTKDHEMFILIV